MDTFFRHEIWHWMETSLSKGTFKWITGTITPVFDIRRLYRKIKAVANEATLISHALEFKKIFTLAPGDDIFQYHADLIKQIKLVKAQGEALELETKVPPWMEQSLLLIAAWQNKSYQQIALDFVAEGKPFTVEAIIRELRKKQLYKSHLSKSSEARETASSSDHSTTVKAAKEPMPKRCFRFSSGGCDREDCPYLHEKAKPEAKAQPKPSNNNKSKPASKKPSEGSAKQSGSAQKCDRCGKAHATRDCSFDGECAYCGKKGHKETVCRSKKAALADSTTLRMCQVANVACDGFMDSDTEQEDEDVTIARIAAERCRAEDPDNPHASSHTPPQSSSLIEPAAEVRVLVVDDPAPAPEVRAQLSVSTTRWCVDSGANRDICKELILFGGKETPRQIAIGEAGEGHSFMSKAEGPICGARARPCHCSRARSTQIR